MTRTHGRPAPARADLPENSAAAAKTPPALLAVQDTAQGRQSAGSSAWTGVLPPQFDPGRSFVGALLHLPAATVTKALALVDDEHLVDHRLRIVTATARPLVGAGVAPDPVLILQVARASGTVTTATAISGLACLLHELHAECPVPASWRYYAAGVLDDALRCRAAEAGTRIAQAADGESIESLLELVGREAAAVDALAGRRRAVDSLLAVAV